MGTLDSDEQEERRLRDVLVDKIAAAFASVPRPAPPVTEGAGPMNTQVEAALAGKTVEQVTPQDARDVRMNLWLLTPAAFVHYLPVLLRMVVAGDTHVDGLGEFAFMSLVPPDDPAATRIFEKRMALLDAAQRAALSEFVRWYSEQESFLPDRDAAAAYWLR